MKNKFQRPRGQAALITSNEYKENLINAKAKTQKRKTTVSGKAKVASKKSRTTNNIMQQSVAQPEYSNILNPLHEVPQNLMPIKTFTNDIMQQSVTQPEYSNILFPLQ